MELKAFLRANADRVLAVGLVLVGVVAVVAGWVGASGTGIAVKQIPYLISGGIGGIILIVIGCTAWLSGDLQDEWRRLAAIEERLEELSAGRTAPSHEAELTADDPSSNGSSPPARPRRKPTGAAQR